MTRIGFAYNQKPEQEAPREGGELEAPRPDEEPPSSADALASNVTALAAASAADEYAEWDSRETIDAVAGALSALGDVVRLEATADFPQRLRETRPDIVFNIAEGLHGVSREAHVPAICEFFGVPYSGSNPLTLSICLDKARTKEVLAYHGVPTAAFALIESAEEIAALRSRIRVAHRLTPAHVVPSERPLHLPLFVKPVHEGSSKGITEKNLCRSLVELEQQIEFLLETYAQPVLVEEFLPGDEFTCAILGNGESAAVLPIVGMNFGALPEGALPIYGFEAKWLWDRPENPLEIFSCPASLTDQKRRAIEAVVLRAYRVLGCRDWSRIDVRLDAAGVPNVVEVNPLPGILPNPEDNSCFPKAARAAGLSYDELIQSCLRHAAERQGIALPGHLARPFARRAVATA
ncbi:MAG: D-alanine--D-alanine ligase [Gemmatimonadaceae bacterium]|nr:D-alanine--D-alanine ligase [Gemmatimonadaceae bacterium]NUQ91711.1 D-alanine--D-alanine ligase [Gemmatimonadaceae bacterium]NUS99042.1 D-alanine--D-alanine ligase [Gemmatimonadaceae bacterium]